MNSEVTSSRRVTHTYIALFGIRFDCDIVDFNVIGLFLFSYFCCKTSPTPDNVTDKAMFVTKRCFWKNFEINSIFYYLMHYNCKILCVIHFVSSKWIFHLISQMIGKLPEIVYCILLCYVTFNSIYAIKVIHRKNKFWILT